MSVDSEGVRSGVCICHTSMSDSRKTQGDQSSDIRTNKMGETVTDRQTDDPGNKHEGFMDLSQQRLASQHKDLSSRPKIH